MPLVAHYVRITMCYPLREGGCVARGWSRGNVNVCTGLGRRAGAMLWGVTVAHGVSGRAAGVEDVLAEQFNRIEG